MRPYRATSLTRRAFAAACEGHAKAVAIDAFPTVGAEVAESKLSRCLAADGDLNLPYVAADLILRANPDVLLRVLAAELGYEAPVKLAAPVESTLERLAESLDTARDTLADIDRQLAEVRHARGMVRVEPAAARRGRVA